MPCGPLRGGWAWPKLLDRRQRHRRHLLGLPAGNGSIGHVIRRDAAFFHTLNGDNEPMRVRLYVLPIDERWVTTILADTADPPARAN